VIILLGAWRSVWVVNLSLVFFRRCCGVGLSVVTFNLFYFFVTLEYSVTRIELRALDDQGATRCRSCYLS